MNGFIQSLINKGGARIEMPAWFQGEQGFGNLAHPNVYGEDAQQKYPAGTKYFEGERRFRYSKYVGKSDPEIHTALDATVGDDLLGKFLFPIGFPVVYSSTYTYGLTGTKIVEVDTATLAIEKNANYYSGGWVNGKDTAPSDARMFFRRIVAMDYSTPKVVGGSEKTLVMTLTVDQDLVNTFTAMTLSLVPNPFKRSVWQSFHNGWSYNASHGASMRNNPAVNSWIWLQDLGPMGTSHIGGDGYAGAEQSEIKLKVLGDGSVGHLWDQTDKYPTHQIAGYLLPNAITETGSGQDDSYPIIWVEVGRGAA